MIKTLKYYYLFLCIILNVNQSVYTQEPVFSQYNLNPIIMNPALSGIDNNWTMTASFRQQWPSLTSKFLTQSCSFDTPLNHAFSSSLSYLKNVEGEGFLSSNYLRSGLSYSIPIIYRNGNYSAFKIGLEYQYYNRSIDWSKLVFLDELHPIYGDIYNSSFIAPDEFTKSIDNNFHLGGALIMNKLEGRGRNGKSKINKYIIVGGSIHNLVERTDAYMFSNYFIPKKYTAHGQFWWSKKSWKKIQIVKQSFFYQQQSIFRTIQIGIFETNFNPFNFGLFVRSQGSMLDNDNNHRESIYFKFGLGYISKKYNLRFKCSYSRDFTISELSTNTNGINEIVLTIQSIKYGIFTNEEKEKKKNTINKIKTSCQFYSDYDFNGNLHNGNFNPVIPNKKNKEGLFELKK